MCFWRVGLVSSFLLFFVLGCLGGQADVDPVVAASSTSLAPPADEACDPVTQSCGLEVQGSRVEVFHFHRTSQCWSCKTLGEFAEKTVNTYFSEELGSGRLVFAHVNVELPENELLAERYGASGSSLMIGVYDSNGFGKEEDTRVWYKLEDEKEYMTYLKAVIEAKLSQE
ncbi:nitrophenyl compound nitroreductase subunit ArsF family protein [Candidatus Altiarchaeota archaeon]